MVTIVTDPPTDDPTITDPPINDTDQYKILLYDTNQYKILSKVEMYVFDNTTVTSPYSDDIGKPAPYDINYYLQGYVVPGELYGSFVASRTITIATDSPGSRAICEVTAEFFALTLNITKNGVAAGTIVFQPEAFAGVITMDSTIIIPGDKLQIEVGLGLADKRIRDIAINLVGCCTVVPCTVL